MLQARWPHCSVCRAVCARGVDSRGVECDGTTGVPQIAVRFRPATKRMVAPASPARYTVYKEQHSCVDYWYSGSSATLSDTPITSQHIFSKMFASKFYFSLQILPSCNIFGRTIISHGTLDQDPSIMFICTG